MPAMGRVWRCRVDGWVCMANGQRNAIKGLHLVRDEMTVEPDGVAAAEGGDVQ